jgi:hypothetical protein
VEIHELLACGLMVYPVIRFYHYTHTRRHAPVLTLKAGETFLGVIDRGQRDCVFIGDAPGRTYRNLTPEDVKLLQQLLHHEGL